MTTDTQPVDWLGLARETGALLEGEFVLTSGKRSPSTSTAGPSPSPPPAPTRWGPTSSRG